MLKGFSALNYNSAKYAANKEIYKMKAFLLIWLMISSLFPVNQSLNKEQAYETIYKNFPRVTDCHNALNIQKKEDFISQTEEFTFIDETNAQTKKPEIPKNNILPSLILFFTAFIIIIGMLGTAAVYAAKKRAEPPMSFANCQTCPECGHQASIKAKFCEMCGAALTKN